MSKKTKTILLVILSMFLPYVGIPLLIVVLLKDVNQENYNRNNNQQSNNQEDIKIKQEDLTPTALNETQLNASNKTIRNTSIPKKQLITLITIASCALFLMLLGIIITLIIPNNSGKTILEATGFIEIFVAIIGFVVFYRKMYYTCPECGTKREHHRKFIETTRRQLVQAVERNSGLTERTDIYTHIYLDTYVCPKCGETEENRATSDGGKVVYDYRGVIRYDNTKPPKEF